MGRLVVAEPAPSIFEMVPDSIYLKASENEARDNFPALLESEEMAALVVKSQITEWGVYKEFSQGWLADNSKWVELNVNNQKALLMGVLGSVSIGVAPSSDRQNILQYFIRPYRLDAERREYMADGFSFPVDGIGSIIGGEVIETGLAVGLDGNFEFRQNKSSFLTIVNLLSDAEVVKIYE